MKRRRALGISVGLLGFVMLGVVSCGLLIGRHAITYRHAVFPHAAMDGNLALMKSLYILGVDVNAPSCEGQSCFTAMWGAAYAGRNDEIEFLLEKGAHVDGRTRFGSTPLMVAVFQGNESTVRLLLAKGADVNAEWSGNTALSVARQKHQEEIAELLLQAGAREQRN